MGGGDSPTLSYCCTGRKLKSPALNNKKNTTHIYFSPKALCVLYRSHSFFKLFDRWHLDFKEWYLTKVIEAVGDNTKGERKKKQMSTFQKQLKNHAF